RKTVTGKTKTEALARLKEAQQAVDAGLTPAHRDLTVARFLEGWLADVLPGTVAPATLQQYTDVVKLYIVPMVGQKRLRTLEPRDVSRMVQRLRTEYVRKSQKPDEPPKIGVAPHTQRIARSVLRRALRSAQQEGSIGRNVASIADGVRIDADEGRTLTPDQARSLLAAVDGHRLEGAFTVALALGLRPGELLGLAWPDIDLEAARPRLTVQRSLKRIAGVGLVL
ncbi:unnamed protein product, partial [Phaeothamnion confervicola]